MLAAIVVGALVSQVAAPPPPASPVSAASPAPTSKKARAHLVIVDDRAVKDQAPAAFLDRAIADIGQREGLKVERLSALRDRLDDKDAQALSGCQDDAGCLASIARALGGNSVVLIRLTRRDGEEARFVAATRINALRPQIQEDAGGIATTEKDALPLLAEQIAELFPEAVAAKPAK